MILKYQKHTDTYTTHALVEPEYTDESNRVVELCAIGADTYVYVPDSVILPEQIFPIEVTMEQISLTDELKSEIKAISPHIRLINQRVVEKIRSRYDSNDEMKMHREYVQGGSTEETRAYIEYVDACRAWGYAEKAKIGLG